MSKCREAFEKWAYGPRYVPDPSSDTEANCWLAWEAAWSACTQSTNRDEIGSKLVDSQSHPKGYFWRRHARDTWDFSEWLPMISDEETKEMRNRGWDVVMVYNHSTNAYHPVKWQPIETAPKDGRTLLLGHRNTLGNWRTLRGRWIPKAEIEEHWEEDDFPEGFYEEAVEADEPNCWPTDPTHWMPLPEPPP